MNARNIGLTAIGVALLVILGPVALGLVWTLLTFPFMFSLPWTIITYAAIGVGGKIAYDNVTEDRPKQLINNRTDLLG